MTTHSLDFGPAPRRARRRPAGLALSPLGAAGFPPFGGTGFAPTESAPADPQDAGFAPTQWLERRRVPREPLASAALPQPLPDLAPARVARARVVAPPPGSLVAGVAGGGLGVLVDVDAPDTAFQAFGAMLERLLDRLVPSALGTFLQLFVCISLSMAALSAMGPLIDRI